MTTWITEALVPAAMFALMVGMGLTLAPADFRRIAAYPRPTVVGTLLQLVAMPLAGIALAHLFALPPLLAVGLVIVAACPGGTMSNLVAHLGRADAALSVTLTATATAATLFTLPLWVRAVHDAGGAPLDMPVLETAARLGAFTVLPVALGMLLRAVRPALARFERALSVGSAVVIVAGLAWESSSAGDLPIAESLAPAAWLCALAFAMGWIVPLATGASAREAATVAIELCVKNTVLGLVLATSSFDAIDPAVPIAAFMTFQMLGAFASIGLLWGWARFAVRPAGA
ncbi:MAG: hypothetical protein R3E88_15385 [Myxococcota bacterium]